MRRSQSRIGAFGLLLAFLVILAKSKEQRLCQGRGYRDTSGSCVCSSGYYGSNCEYKRCPFGKSWISPPKEDNVRYSPMAVCSNMGICNVLNGTCACRSGYDGEACQRLACPTPSSSTLQSSSVNLKIVANADGTLSTVAQGSSSSTTTTTVYPPCGTHGVCLTLREAGRSFDGILLTRPPVDYDFWDADRVQGCVCDVGYTGYDCSLRSCPMGKDPTLASTPYDKEEVFVLECMADSGFFSLLVLGHYTEPIPYDAEPGYLQYLLQALPNVGRVQVVGPRISGEEHAAICSSDSIVSTRIQFLDLHGDRPPILATRNTANTRQWPNGADQLSLSSSSDGTPVLRFATVHYLHCAPCPHCYGKVYFRLGSSLSSKINVTSNNATGEILNALHNLDGLTTSGWTNFAMEVKINNYQYSAYDAHVNNSLCSTSFPVTTEIRFLSDYGNTDFLDFIDGTSLSRGRNHATANLTWTTNAGNGTLFECSNQGSCDYSTGICQCVQDLTLGVYNYRAISSDGNGNIGGRGDCGYIAVPPQKCIFAQQECSGNGVCNNVTFTCTCNEGYYGVLCAFKKCPMGPALFDEPFSATSAHHSMECSNTGTCDRRTGMCVCHTGFTGPACNIKDCPRSSSGEACHGNGKCLTIASYYSTFGFSYGNASLVYLDGGKATWDAFNWYECLCSAQLSAGALGLPSLVSVGPRGIVSGIAVGSPPLPGWTGYDCSLRRCPVGHNTLTGRDSQLDIQRVVCTRAATPGLSFSIVLPFADERTQFIANTATADDIKAAIEWAPSIGNVTVWFPLDDGVDTACSSSTNTTHGGFLVRFDTEFGDLPLMKVNSSSSDIIFSKHQSGYNSLEECSGSSLGFCNRETGVCACNERQTSSNGVNQPGLAGDCSYFVPYPRPDDSIVVFGGQEED